MAQNTYFLLIKGVNKLIDSLVKNQEVEDISIKNFVRKTMSFHDGSDESYKVFLNYFDWLSIKNASIYTFEKPVLHTNGEEYIPTQKFIKKAVLRSGKVYERQEVFGCSTWQTGNSLQLLLAMKHILF